MDRPRILTQHFAPFCTAFSSSPSPEASIVAQPLQPLFCDITWGAGGSTADLTLDIAAKMQNEMCVETMMHLTCTNMPQEKLKEALDRVRSDGIQNILALRGDPPKGATSFTAVEGGFACALDLVRYIRQQYGDFFGLTVAGYPEARYPLHPPNLCLSLAPPPRPPQNPPPLKSLVI